MPRSRGQFWSASERAYVAATYPALRAAGLARVEAVARMAEHLGRRHSQVCSHVSRELLDDARGRAELLVRRARRLRERAATWHFMRLLRERQARKRVREGVR